MENDYKQFLEEHLRTNLHIKYKYPAEIPVITDKQRLERIKGYMECMEDMNNFLKYFTLVYGK